MKINDIRDTTSGKVYDVSAFPINKVNIYPVAGNSFNIGLRCKRSMFDAKPVDPKLGTFRMDVTTEAGDKTVLIFSSGAEIAPEDNNVLRLKKSGAEMSIDPGVYFYQLVQTTSSEVITLMEGSITVKASIAALVPKKVEPMRIDNELIIADNQIIIT